MADSYNPGNQMSLAVRLSRAAQKEITKPEDSFQVFSVDLENTFPIQAASKISPERLEQLQQDGRDESLQTRKTTVLTRSSVFHAC